jgi:signal-transduction protein with cAMP-binding, CBS, and nucleotidyltransferase domain
MVRRQELLQAINARQLEAPIATIMQAECLPVDENAMLRDTFDAMQRSACRALPVLRQGRLVGLLTLDNIGEWLMVHSAQGDTRTSSAMRPLAERGAQASKHLARRG